MRFRRQTDEKQTTQSQYPVQGKGGPGGNLPSESPPDMILIYDKLENHKGEIRHVLFADYRTLTPNEQEFQKAIDRDNQFRRELGLPEKPGW